MAKLKSSMAVVSLAGRRYLRIAGTAIIFLSLCSARSEAQGVMAWPAEKLTRFDESYFVAVTDERQRKHPWVVFAARDSVSTFRDIDCTEPLETLEFLQSLYVKKMDEDARVVYLVEARMGAADRYAEAQVTKEWGWVRMNDLLLSHRPFRNPDTFVPQRALVKTAMNTQDVATVPKLYAAPSDSARVLRELAYTSFSYVYGVGFDDPSEERGPYDPRYGYDWYLVSSRGTLNARPGTDAVGPRDHIGWLRGDHALIWNTREALEPVVGRTRSANVFDQSDSALNYAMDANSIDRLMLRDDTPISRTWIGQRFRYPVLGQRPQERSGAKARLIAFQGPVRFGGGNTAANRGALETALHGLRDTTGEPKIIFIVDGTMSMCDYIADTIETAADIVEGLEDKNIEFEVGAVVYKDKADRTLETQVFSSRKSVASMMSSLRRLDCTQPSDDDYEESLLKGIHDAWGKALRDKSSLVAYVLMGDAGSSYKEALDFRSVASELALNSDGSWNPFAFQAFHILHNYKNPSEKTAIAKFESDVKNRLFGIFEELEEPFLDLTANRKSPFAYSVLNVYDSSAWQAAAAQAADAIVEWIASVEFIRNRAEEMLVTGAPLIDEDPAPGRPGQASNDDPVATRIMEAYLRSRLGDTALQLTREQRTQIFYEGWVPTYDAGSAAIMAPVLFLEADEAGNLIFIARDVLADTSCYRVKEFFIDLIGTISPESERLPIHILIEKRQGIRFRSPLLQVPYVDIDNMCTVDNSEKFGRLINSFSELELALEEMRGDKAREYSLLDRKFYWLPMDRLP